MRLGTTTAVWASLLTLASAQSSASVSASSPSPSSSSPSSSSALLVPVVGTTLTIAASQATASTTYAPSSATGSSSAAAVSTSVPKPTAPLNSTVDEGILPTPQYLCNGGENATYCPGELLQLVQLSGIFPDSKTFPDKPTKYSLNETYFAFSQLAQRGNITYGDVVTFVEGYFQGEGLELVAAQIENFTTTPEFLSNVDDVVYKGFSSIVHGYWTLLIRETNQSVVCDGVKCDSSVIPLNNSVVVPGGRYREVYYWDSFWIMEGLLKSELYNYANDLLNNFMDLIDAYGFIPNGGRKYYLNRSQPPVFTLMVNAYVLATGNTTVLERALPLLETELEWWRTNRTISVTSPYTNKTHSVARFAVNNTAPRPEGYVEDYKTVFGATPALDQAEREDLLAELASGAESGWDYSARWSKQISLNKTDPYGNLRKLNVRAIVPVDLNALLYADHVILANLYETYMNSTAVSGNSSMTNGTTSAVNTGNMTSQVAAHRMIASELEAAILDLCWDPVKSWFYDYNTTANARSDIYHAGGTFPLWHNITPPEIAQNETAALNVFQGLRFIAGTYAGLPNTATLLDTGLNWDLNSWPPHAYSAIKAFEAVGRLYPNGTVLDEVVTTDFSLVPVGQFGLNKTQLPVQNASLVSNNTATFRADLTAIQAGKPWWQALAIEFANRYMQSSFCSWYSTGGSIPNLLQGLTSEQVGASGGNANDTGHIFEKFSPIDPDAAGGGGEYTVVIGFGWSNGVILHTAGEYGQYLVPPSCPLIQVVEANSTSMVGNSTAMYQGFRIPPAK
ncbi:hypothetical protein QFC19_004970 [Naganishia cerealis]|uniref:Uncharacterized protein n=1 Tax=Naganishia cerealis TaxID=610337 RepID=A0ACC2VT10_9TREE|nr:hypothetical protein QFC19_004970 [Naganishia cerealis]